MAAIDLVAISILAIALLRGLFLGVIREAFSIAALAGAVVVGRTLAVSAGVWLRALTGPSLGETAATVLGGILLGLAVWIGVRLVGRWLRRGVHAVGLGFLDRAGGAVLGGAEGVLVVTLLLLVGIALVGRDHPSLAGSRTLETFQEAEQIARGESALPAVAAPGPG